MLPILVSVPHGGLSVPPELRGRVIASDRDIFEDSDAATLDVYHLKDEVVRFERTEIARAFVDLNRASDDRPPANPDGVVKSETCFGRPIYDPAAPLHEGDITALLDRYYFPYHSRLEIAASDPGVKLAVDCHSMAAAGPPTSPDTGQPRPLFCLSNREGETCPEPLIHRMADAFAEAFEIDRSDVSLNAPFKGGYITRHHGSGELPWVQIEMNRSLYLADPWLDETSLVVDPGRIADLRARVLAALSASVRGL